MSNNNNNKKYRYSDASHSYNKSNNPGKNSTVEYYEIGIVGAMPSLNRNFSPIGREIIIK